MSRALPRPLLLRLALAPLVALAAGCGASDAAAAGDESDLTDATLTFGAGFGVAQSSELRSGGKVRVRYAPERLPQCRMGLNDGSPGWTITGFASMNGEAARSFYVAGHSADPRVDSTRPLEPTIELTAGGDLALWFQVTNAQGCSEFDSRGGANHRFRVER